MKQNNGVMVFSGLPMVKNMFSSAFRLPVVFNECQGDKEIEVGGGDVTGRPDCLPNPEYFVVGELPLEVQKKPPAAE